MSSAVNQSGAPAEGIDTPLEAVSEPILSSGLTALEHGIIDIFIRTASLLGFPKSVGEIYGLLFASPKPLSLNEIVERLNISKGSASQGLQALRSTGAIKLIYIAGDRRDHFEPETELRALVSGFLREKVQPHLESVPVRIEALQKEARSALLSGTQHLDGARILRDRIDKLSSWHRKGKTVVPLVIKLFG